MIITLLTSEGKIM